MIENKMSFSIISVSFLLKCSMIFPPNGHFLKTNRIISYAADTVNETTFQFLDSSMLFHLKELLRHSHSAWWFYIPEFPPLRSCMPQGTVFQRWVRKVPFPCSPMSAAQHPAASILCRILQMNNLAFMAPQEPFFIVWLVVTIIDGP